WRIECWTLGGAATALTGPATATTMPAITMAPRILPASLLPFVMARLRGRLHHVSLPAYGGGQGGDVVTRARPPPQHPVLDPCYPGRMGKSSAAVAHVGDSPRMGEEGPVGEPSRRRGGLSGLMRMGVLGFLVVASTVATVFPVSAASGIGIFVGYADSVRANPTNFPTPWEGSPNTIFEGCPSMLACTFDAGAVQVVNNTGAAVTVNAVAVHVGSCTFAGWPSPLLPTGGSLALTQ